MAYGKARNDAKMIYNTPRIGPRVSPAMNDSLMSPPPSDSF